MSEKESLDLLGIKGLSDSIRIATERSLDGAAAFLSRVCLPALEELGLALRDRVSAWRARNATRMLSRANELLDQHQSGTGQKIHPRLVHVALEEGSWIEDEQVQNMWAGLLASAVSPDGRSDENLVFINILKQLSSLEVRILSFSVERAAKFNTGHGLPFARDLSLSIRDVVALAGEHDLQRLDRELDHLRELGLIGAGGAGGIMLGTDRVNLTPTSLALHL